MLDFPSSHLSLSLSLTDLSPSLWLFLAVVCVCVCYCGLRRILEPLMVKGGKKCRHFQPISTWPFKNSSTFLKNPPQRWLHFASPSRFSLWNFLQDLFWHLPASKWSQRQRDEHSGPDDNLMVEKKSFKDVLYSQCWRPHANIGKMSSIGLK